VRNEAIGVVELRGEPWQSILELSHDGPDAAVIPLHP